MKLLYEIFIVNDSNPANPDYLAPFVRLKYLGGATGVPKGRIYKTGDPPPAFTSIAVSALNVPADAGDTYEVEYQDDGIALKKLAIVNVNEWVGGCFADHITINWISVYRFSTKVQVDWFGSPTVASSIDDGSTWKTNIFSGVGSSAEWTDAELNLLGFTDLVPSVKTRRSILASEQTVSSFADPMDVDWPAMGFTRVNVPNGLLYGLGTNVNFSPTTNYGSGTVVENGAGYIIIQHSFNGNPSGVKVGYSSSCVTNILEDFFIGDLVIAEFVLTESHTDVTVEGGSDGTITLGITGGSGNFTYVWDDGPTTQNRNSLPAGDYTVTVTDTITGQEEELTITINEPNVQPVEGTFVEVPFMNSLHWVDKTESADFINNPQALDNRLLCEQEFEGFEQTNYFNKVCKADTRILQFYSDYANFKIRAYEYGKVVPIKEFGWVLKEQNIGIPEDFMITIRNHTGFPGQSRVYFNVGAIPIPLVVGAVFTIFNNLDGFNGNYAIESIQNDFTLGYQYLVINKNYAVATPTSAATGRFFTSAVDFNVFESAMTFAELEGEYYCTLVAINLAGEETEILWQSEPIDVQEVHKKTNLIEIRNKDNAFGITWTTGYILQLRVESHLFKRLPGGERSTNRNADYSLTKINAKKTRGVLFETYFLPPYLHEKLSVGFDCDSYTINKVAFQSTDAYAEPKYVDDFMLADSSIKIEQQKWFDNYNSDDLGTVNEGGFLIHEGGFIKL